MKKFLFTALILLQFCNLIAQDIVPSQNLSANWLLLNPDIQMECNDAINDLYNFKFDKAEEQFNKLKNQYPHHPISYFLIGLSEYWKIVPDDKVESYDARFFAYMDSSILYAEELYKEDKNNKEAIFFMVAAHGFKGRVLALRDKYTKAAWEAKRTLDDFDFEDMNNELSPEFRFGLGLYNYFREWIPDEKPWLKMIVFPFKSGDKEKGIRQLNEVALNAFYTRTEAYYYLLEIYMYFEPQHLEKQFDKGDISKEDYEHKKSKLFGEAMKTAKFLHESYPDNSYFQRAYAKLCYLGHHLTTMEHLSEDMIDKCNKGYFGYTDLDKRHASYFLAEYLMSHLAQYDRAEKYYQICIDVCEKNKLMYGYYIYSLEKMTKLMEMKKDYDAAIVCTEKILKHANKKKPYEKTSYENAKTLHAQYKKMKKQAESK